VGHEFCNGAKIRYKVGGLPNTRKVRIDVIYEMIMKKNPVSPPEYWATLLSKLEDELNMGWSIVSATPEKLDERQKVLKEIVQLVHKTVVEAEHARQGS
jgi:hypothetical protein